MSPRPLPLLLCLYACAAPDARVREATPPREQPGGGLEVVIEGGTNVDAVSSLAEAVAVANELGGHVQIVLPPTEQPLRELPLRVTAPFVSIRSSGTFPVAVEGVLPGQPLLTFAPGAVGGRLEGLELRDVGTFAGTVVRVEAGQVDLVDVALSGSAGSLLVDVAGQAHADLTGCHLSGMHTGVHVAPGGSAGLDRTIVEGGTVGVVIEGGTNVRVLQSLFVGAEVAIRAVDGTVELTNSTVADAGCAVELSGTGGHAALVNDAITGTDELFLCQGAATVRVERVYADGGEQLCGTVEGEVVVADLQLDEDYRPAPTSPLVDAGGSPDELPGVRVDLTGVPRPADGDLDGVSAIDIGAFESTTSTCPAWSVTSEPAVGEWTGNLAPRPLDACADAPTQAGGVLRGRLTALDPAGPITLEYFTVDPTALPRTDVRWTLLDATLPARCDNLDLLPEVASGTWPASRAMLQITADPWVWLPTDDAFSPPLARRLVLVLGDQADPHGRVWFSPQAITLGRTCY